MQVFKNSSTQGEQIAKLFEMMDADSSDGVDRQEYYDFWKGLMV